MNREKFGLWIFIVQTHISISMTKKYGNKYCDVYSSLTCIYFLLIFFEYSIHENNIFVLKYEVRIKTRKVQNIYFF